MEQFESYRPLLFSIAYRMLGSAMEAEDIVQETYLRYQSSDHANIQSHKAYLTTIVTRLSINHLNSARVQRETHLGPWLPEPIMTSDDTQIANPSSHLSLYESISMAFLVILETLSPPERAVFLLREVFDYDYADIASILDKSEASCRQLFSRAKKHIVDNRPRYESTPQEHERLLKTFIQAVQAGEIEQLMNVLAEDVALIPDGVGQRGAATHILYGQEAIARFIFGTQRFVPPDVGFAIESINGSPALVMRAENGEAFGVVSIAIKSGKVKQIHANFNPSKLGRLKNNGKQ